MHEETMPLAGVRVLDLACASGAFAGRLLAMLGADVVMAEPRGGHRLRARESDFWFYAAGKRSVVGDPSLTESLARAADVAIVSAPAAERPQGLAADAVLASISPFDPEGPRAGWRAGDLVAQATGGMLAASGLAEGPPLQAAGLQAYHQAGIFTAIGVVAGLCARERTGQGGTVAVSLERAVAAAVERGTDPRDGTPAVRDGRLHWTRLFRVGRGRDGWGLRATVGDWTTLVEWMKADGAAADLDDPAYEDVAVRQVCADHVFDVIDSWARRYDVRDLAAAAQLRRLPFAAVQPPEALPADAQLVARRFFVPSQVPFPGPPFRLGPLPPRFAQAPALDGDRHAVRHEWLESPRRFDLLGSGERPAGTATWGQPLDGVRVLDFTWQVAGPTATRILADLGAEVVKVEHPKLAPAGGRPVDLATPEGLAYARRLVTSADVVIDNFSARVMENLGLGHAVLRRLRPDVICVRMTGFGTTGPDRDHVSFGPTLQARAGFTQLMADPAGGPVGFGYSYSDLASGHLAALAVLAALWRRRRTGEGAFVDFSQLEALVALIGPLVLARTLDGRISEPIGHRSQEAPAAPHGVYRCAGENEWIAVSVFTDEEWQRFGEVIGKPSWTQDVGFATIERRVRAGVELDRLVGEWSRTADATVAAAMLQGAGVPAGRVAAPLAVSGLPFRLSGIRSAAGARPLPRQQPSGAIVR